MSDAERRLARLAELRGERAEARGRMLALDYERRELLWSLVREDGLSKAELGRQESVTAWAIGIVVRKVDEERGIPLTPLDAMLCQSLPD